MNEPSFAHSISHFREKQVAVVGDLMLDHYVSGEVHRISPEAPIPVLRKSSETFVLGGAANVAANVTSLGGHAILCGVIGGDAAGDSLLQLVKHSGIDARGIVRDTSRPTTVKQRVVAGGHQLVRIDAEDTSRLSPASETALLTALSSAFLAADIVILSDYGKGVFSKKIADAVFALAKQQGKKVLADFKPEQQALFLNADLVSPNLKEAREMSGEQDPERAGAVLAGRFRGEVFVTRGGDGISIFHRDRAHYHVPGRRVSVFDVSGAGDTVIATTALALAVGADTQAAAHLANIAGSIAVQKPGTATVAADELLSHFSAGQHLDTVAIVPKVWGYEKWLENNDKYCCKLLSLNKGYQCSLHYHKNKDEMFLVTKGRVKLEKGTEVLHLSEGAFARIEPGVHHRFTGLEDSLIMEVSTHHDEADSYRLEESRRVA